jgi:hypothetical protein
MPTRSVTPARPKPEPMAAVLGALTSKPVPWSAIVMMTSRPSSEMSIEACVAPECLTMLLSDSWTMRKTLIS